MCGRPDGAFARGGVHRLERDGNAEGVEPLDDLLRAIAARFLELIERGRHVLRMREVQPEHVNLVSPRRRR